MATLLSEIGSNLAEARLRRGLSLEDVQAETRIRARYLTAMEDERFGDLPGEGYAKCFLRSYADYLGLDGPATVAAFNARFGPSEPAVPVTHVRARRARSREPLALLVVAVGMLAAVGILGWRLTDVDDLPPPAPAAEAPVEEAATRPVPTVPATEPVAAAKPAPAAPQVLHLTARADCWLEVRLGGPRGKLLWTGTLKPGRALRFGLGKPVWIRAGAPHVLRAHIAGEPKAFPTGATTLVATAEGMRAAG